MAVTQGSGGLFITCVWVSGFFSVLIFLLYAGWDREGLLIGRGVCILHRKGLFRIFMAQGWEWVYWLITL